MSLICGTRDLQLARAEEFPATWPNSCRYAIGIYIDDSKWPGDASMGIPLSAFYRAFDRACEEWNTAIGIKFYLESDFATALCYVDFASLSGSTLAWSNLADGDCSDDKRQRYDIRRWDENTLFLTAVHELGHLLGLGHSGSGIMTPSINTSLSGVTAVDVRRAKSLGYGDPQDDPQDPPPPNTPIDYDKLLDMMAADGRFKGPRGSNGPIGPMGRTGPKGDTGDVNEQQLDAVVEAITAVYELFPRWRRTSDADEAMNRLHEVTG